MNPSNGSINLYTSKQILQMRVQMHSYRENRNARDALDIRILNFKIRERNVLPRTTTEYINQTCQSATTTFLGHVKENMQTQMTKHKLLFPQLFASIENKRGEKGIST